MQQHKVTSGHRAIRELAEVAFLLVNVHSHVLHVDHQFPFAYVAALCNRVYFEESRFAARNWVGINLHSFDRHRVVAFLVCRIMNELRRLAMRTNEGIQRRKWEAEEKEESTTILDLA